MQFSEANIQRARLIQLIKTAQLDMNWVNAPSIDQAKEIAQRFLSLSELYTQYSELLFGRPLVLPKCNLSDRTQLWQQWALLSEQLNFFAPLGEQKHSLLTMISLSKQISNLLVLSDEDNQFVQWMKNATIESFLTKVVEYWNQTELQEFASSQFFSKCSKDELQRWIRYFTEPEFLRLFNQLFYYKSSPELLFDLRLSAEKLISVQSRLDFIYQLLEMLQAQLQSSLKLHGLSAFTDLLLHGDELPAGVQILRQDALRESILMAIQKMKFKTSATQETEENQDNIEQVRHMMLAYKFWFNPDRLIDSVMVLNQQWEKEMGQALDETRFTARMLALFSLSSTSECLDLYGYFANKDTRYFMMTLRGLIEQRAIDWERSFSAEEISLLTKIEAYLLWTSAALRQLLSTREVETAAYSFALPLPDSRLAPGQRNKTAIERILSLYRGLDFKPRRSIDELFNLFEDK